MFLEKERNLFGKKRNSNDECLICFQKKEKYANLLTLFFDDDLICQKCRSSFTVINKEIEVQGIKCHTIYLYDDFFSQLIIQYKELCDEALAPIFLCSFKKTLQRKYRGYTIVCCPSSQEKLNERGFNHIYNIYKLLNYDMISPFIKTDNIEQKTKGKKQRKQIINYIKLKEDLILPNTPLLLVDDVVTTGSTIKSCYELVKKHPYGVKVLVLSATKHLIEGEKSERYC